MFAKSACSLIMTYTMLYLLCILSHLTSKILETTFLLSPDSTQSAALVGGVAGGVGGSLLLVIIVLVVIVGVFVCQVRRRGHAKLNVSGKSGANNKIAKLNVSGKSGANNKI